MSAQNALSPARYAACSEMDKIQMWNVDGVPNRGGLQPHFTINAKFRAP
jgi:Zn ribbon nucleic-acid-binding protein